jgi:hypothetical protein
MMQAQERQGRVEARIFGNGFYGLVDAGQRLGGFTILKFRPCQAGPNLRILGEMRARLLKARYRFLGPPGVNQCYAERRISLEKPWIFAEGGPQFSDAGILFLVLQICQPPVIVQVWRIIAQLPGLLEVRDRWGGVSR